MSTTPTRIRRSDPSKVVFEWADGLSAEFSAADLRRRCPCAACVSETTGQRMLDPSSIPDDLTQAGLHLVGNYAVGLRFSDGHETGIYTYSFLRAAGQPD
jgi:ATP-binding protein involved in chromosome partitioning